MASQRYARANSPYVQDFDPSKPTNYMMYLDANNLYDWAMSRALPNGYFKWLRGYVEKNMACRAAVSTTFEKDFFKLMVNSVFEKTMENIHNRVDVRLVNSEKVARTLVAKPNFKHRTVFSEDLAAVHLHCTKLVFDKPIYLGFSILDLSKTLMADFVYDYLKPRYGDRLSICYTDTDSLICDIQTADVYKDMAESVQQCFDTSNYAPDHASEIQVGVNKKVTGKFKDECAGRPMTEYVGLRPKTYAFEIDREECKRAKGVRKSVVETNLTFADHKECLDTGKEKYRSMNIIRSRLHQVLTLETCKKPLSANDDKRHILPDGISTLAHGHYRITHSSK